MNESVRQELEGLARVYPQETLLERRRLEALLKDKCPENRVETHVILCALQSGVPQTWMRHEESNGGKLDSMMADMVNRLSGNYGMEPRAAGWAVETWGYALRRFSHAEVGKRDWGRITKIYAAAGAAPRHLLDENTSVLSPGVNPVGAGRKPAPAPVPARARRDDPNVLVVAPNGKGRFPTINHAVAISRPGQKILLEKGTYREGMRITKDVEIIGEGLPHEVIIECNTADGINICTDRAVVRNLSVLSKPSPGFERIYAVHVHQGTLIMQDCVITAAGHAAVAVHGARSNPQFLRCVIACGPTRGLIVWDAAKGTFTDCEIRNFEVSCVDVCDWATPHFVRCKIQRGASHGIYVHTNGAPTFTECEISNFALGGVSITHGGNPTLDRCDIHHIKSYAINVSNHGEGIIRNCHIHSNMYPGVYVEKGSRPRITEGSSVPDKK
ncbi:hypothetical protein DB346_05765 [Verrucomicrobia bacterium LW23]|nr:hypothetical protein DB346_05765 [Verrucomicrobia bacterium LW23]